MKSSNSPDGRPSGGRLKVGALLVAAAVLAAACGGSDDAAAPAAPAPAPAPAPGDAPDTTDELRLPDDYQAVVLQNAHHNAPTTWLARTDQQWADDISDLTDGKIAIEFNWASSLAGPADSAEALGSGTSQIGLAFPVFAPGGFDVTTWISTLSFLNSPHPIIGDMQAWAASVEWGLSTPAQIAEFHARGIQPLLPHIETNATYYLACTSPVTTLADARGKSVRVAGAAWRAEAEALGMTPVQLPIGEVFEALQRGVIDCTLNPFRDLVDFGLLAAATEITFDPDQSFSGFNFSLATNKAWWDAQPVEARQIIWSTLGDYAERQMQAAITQDFVLLEQADALGLTIHAMQADFRSTLSANQEERLAAAVANAPAVIAADAEAIVAEFQRLNDKWYDIIVNELGYGSQIPATWDEVIATGLSPADIDFGPWAQRVYEEIFAPRMPN